MRMPFITGLSFGLTSGIITTLGLMVGLNSGTHSKIAVIGGILTIAIADAFSDALGIHVSQESQNRSERSVWISTVSTFVTKFLFALTFLIPILLFELSTAIIIGVIWGFSTLFLFSYIIGKKQGSNPWRAAFEHLVIGILVVTLTHFLGNWIEKVIV